MQIAQEQHANTSLGPLIAGSVVFFTGKILRMVSPKFGVLVAEEAARKGYLRFIHSRIITNSEEIAFYSGQKVEQTELESAYRALVKQSNKIQRSKLWYVMLEQFLMKYGWTGAGMILISIPILTSKKPVTTTGAGAMGNYYFNKTKYFRLRRYDEV